MEKIPHGDPQGYIMIPLLLLIHINHHHKVTQYLDLIMFADDKNLFQFDRNAKPPFQIVNSELKF